MTSIWVDRVHETEGQADTQPNRKYFEGILYIDRIFQAMNNSTEWQRENFHFQEKKNQGSSQLQIFPGGNVEKHNVSL